MHLKWKGPWFFSRGVSAAFNAQKRPAEAHQVLYRQVSLPAWHKSLIVSRQCPATEGLDAAVRLSTAQLQCQGASTWDTSGHIDACAWQAIREHQKTGPALAEGCT